MRPLELLAGKVFGGIAVTIVQIAVVLLFTRYVLGAYWGRDLLTVAAILVAQAVMAVAIGAGTAHLIRNEGAAIGALNALIPVLAMFGGGFVPLDVMGPSFDRIATFDRLRWVNRAIFGVIYGGEYSAVAEAQRS